MEKKPDVVEPYVHQHRSHQIANWIDKSPVNQDSLQATVYLSPSDLSVLAELAKEELYDIENEGGNRDILAEMMIDLADQKENSEAIIDDDAGTTKERKYPKFIDSKDADDSLTTDEEKAAKQELVRRWRQILSWDEEARSLYNPVDSPEDLNNDDNGSSLPKTDNIYGNNPKFERQERQDVKKPGPLFSVNNFAFADDDEDTMKEDQLPDLWVLSNGYSSALMNQDIMDLENKKDIETDYQSASDDDFTNSFRLAALLEKLNDEQESQEPSPLDSNEYPISTENLSATWSPQSKV